MQRLCNQAACLEGQATRLGYLVVVPVPHVTKLELQLLVLLLEVGNVARRLGWADLAALSRRASALSTSSTRWRNRWFSACANASLAMEIAARSASISASRLASQRACRFTLVNMMKATASKSDCSISYENCSTHRGEFRIEQNRADRLFKK